MTSLSQLPVDPVAILTGHNGAVHALTYSSGAAQYILTGSTDRIIRLFNPAKASPPAASKASHTPSNNSNRNLNKNLPSQLRPHGLVQSYAGHAYEVLDIAVTQDNAKFVSVGGDKQVLLWDVAQAIVLRRFDGHSSRVNTCCWGGDGREDSVVITGSFDTTVKVWDVKANSSKPIITLSDAKDSISSVAVSASEIHAGSVDGKIRTYDIRRGAITVDVVASPINAITISRNNDALLVGTLDSTLRLFEKTSGRLLQSFKHPELTNHNYRIRSIFFNNDSIVLSGSENGKIFAWDTIDAKAKILWHNEEMKNNQNSKKNIISCVASCSSRNEWCSAGGDGTVTIWGSK